jgi:hypothetical protein
MHHAQKHKHVGDHDRGEELKKVLSPEMNDPEAPKIRGCEV